MFNINEITKKQRGLKACAAFISHNKFELLKTIRYPVICNCGKQVMQGACGFLKKVYLEVNALKKNAKATQQNAAYTQLAGAYSSNPKYSAALL